MTGMDGLFLVPPSMIIRPSEIVEYREIKRFSVSGNSIELKSLISGGARKHSDIELLDDGSDQFFIGWKWGENICHWIFDVMAGGFFIYDFEGPESTLLVNPKAANVRHCREWINFLGFKSIVLGPNDEEPIGRSHVAFLEHFSGRCHVGIIESVRRFIPLALKFFQNGPEHILVKRCAYGHSNSSSRNIENSVEVEEFFRAKGIPLAVIYLEGMSIFQQMAWFANAKTVIAVHGAGITNIVFCNPDCRIIEIAHPLFWQAHYADCAGILGLRFATLNGLESPSNPCGQHGINTPVIVPPPSLMDTLNEV